MIATVFLGPSLSRQEARSILPEAIYRPPAAQGDLLAAVDQDGAEVIGLVDGTFHHNLSVWHNEVCYLLNRGITVLGASSMGALRAAETDCFGTIGVGSIYRWYREGIITGDDEVALIHGDEDSGFIQMSLALVNIRASLAQAVSRGSLDSDVAEKVVGITRSLYYPRRLASVILERCRDSGFSPELVSSVERVLTIDHVDLKGADAREMLTLMRAFLDESVPRPERVPFDFVRSGEFETLYNLDRNVAVEGTQVSLQAIREHVALHCSEFVDIRRAALDRAIVVYFALLLGIEPTPEEVCEQRSNFLDKHGLTSPDALANWLRDNAMEDADLSEYLAEEALCKRLRRWVAVTRSFDRGCRALLDELRMRGSFIGWAKSAADEQKVCAAFRNQPEYRAVDDEDPRYLAAIHAIRTNVRITGDARIWAEDAGFDGAAGLLDGLKRATVYADVKARVARQLSALERAEAAITEFPSDLPVPKLTEHQARH